MEASLKGDDVYCNMPDRKDATPEASEVKNGGRNADILSNVYKVFAASVSLALLGWLAYQVALVQNQQNDIKNILDQITDANADLMKGIEKNFTRFQKKLLEIRTDINETSTTDCRKVNPNSAKIWNGTGGVFVIYPEPFLGQKTEVYCDTSTQGGGWLVFQRRMDGSVDFYRNYEEYVDGFGDDDKEFWLGLEKLHKLTSSQMYELRIDLEDWNGNKRYAQYSSFVIGDSTSSYQLSIGSYSGTAGDSFLIQNGQKFTAKNRDNDRSGGNCAQLDRGAWWYNACHRSNLNGYYYHGGTPSVAWEGVVWLDWTGHSYSLKHTEMKIRLLE